MSTQTYNYDQLKKLARRAGFSAAEAGVMAAIALAESGGRINANNAGLNSDGSVDYGLWQINSVHGFDTQRLTSDPLYNARMAYKVYKEQGLHAWTTFTSGAYKQYLNGTTGGESQVIQSAGGGGEGGSLGGAAGNNEFSKADIAGALDNLGLPKGLIDSNASLRQAFNKIIKQRLDLNTQVGQDRAMAIIKNTQWWQNHSAAQRKFDTLKVDDPQEYARQLAQKANDVKQAAQQMGVALSGNELQHLAFVSLRNGFDNTELTQSLAGHFEYKKNGTYTGQAGQDIQGLQKLASEYWTRLPAGRIDNMTQRMLAGDLTPEAMQDFFRQQAESRFGHLKKQLDSGLTIQDIASPYVGAMSQLLEVAPTAIKAGDNTILKALQQPDGNGGFQLMPEWQFEDTLRNDPRWLKTDNARDSLLSIGHDLLKSWGVAT